MPSGAISPLALQPRVPLRAAAYKPGREIWGSVIADYTDMQKIKTTDLK